MKITEIIPTTIYFSREQYDALRKAGYEQNLKITEMVRRAVDEYLAKQKKK